MTHPKLAVVNREKRSTEKIVNDVLNTIKVLQGPVFLATQPLLGWALGLEECKKSLINVTFSF